MKGFIPFFFVSFEPLWFKFFLFFVPLWFIQTGF